jgi:hypothetical protein
LKNIIIIVGLVLLGIAIVGILTGTVQTGISGLLSRTVTDIGAVNP